MALRTPGSGDTQPPPGRAFIIGIKMEKSAVSQPQQGIKPGAPSFCFFNDSKRSWLSFQFLFGHYLESYFEKQANNRLHQNAPSRSGFSLLRAIRTWSQICRCPFDSLGDYFSCVSTGGAIQPLVSWSLGTKRGWDVRVLSVVEPSQLFQWILNFIVRS